MNSLLENLARPSVLAMKPYSSARDEFSGTAAVFMDANENPYNAPYNRYPDPHQRKLKQRIAAMLDVEPGEIFLGNGSDEAIDLLIRVFCEPQLDYVAVTVPSYGMYEVAASVNNVNVAKVNLNSDFTLSAKNLLSAVSDRCKLLFLCSPNNPSGNLLNNLEIITILENFKGIVAVDEAYIDFAGNHGFLYAWRDYPKLVVLRTFSKAWGMAGLRLGMALASQELIGLMDKIKYPYNINMLTQEYAFKVLQDTSQKDEWVSQILHEREGLVKRLALLPYVEKIFPSDANFLLVKTSRPHDIYNWLTGHSVIVRDRSSVNLCEGCLRITVGTQEENNALLTALISFPNE